jgi:predicted amidohydrolase
VTGGQPTGPLRVAAAETSAVAGDVSANVATARTLTLRAAELGVRVLVLPELFLTGYAPQAWSLGAALDLDDARLDPLREVTREQGVVVVASAAVRRADADGGAHATLSTVVVDDAGEVSAPYDKQHLVPPERTFFTRGDHGASLVVDGWELGLGICYDGCFPAHAAAAADDGALAYLCPAAYLAGSEHRRDLYYAARALDNGIYVALAGLSGRCGDQDFCGGSAVYDPEGRPVGRPGGTTPELVLADLDASVVIRAQQDNPLRADRLAGLGSRRRMVIGDPGADLPGSRLGA